MKNERRVVVTGYGAITSLGKDSTETWQGIHDYRVGYARYEHPDESVTAKFFGNIDAPLDLSRFSKRILKNLPRFARLGLIAADEAINHAFPKGDMETVYDPFQRGVIMGTGWGGTDDLIENANMYTESGMAHPLSNIRCMHSVCTAAISMKYGLRGYQNTPIAACATSNIAIGDAFRAIQNGHADMILAGGAESICDPFGVWMIDVLGALSKEQDDPRKACCPFSLDRNGFVLSEGGAVLCLEAYESAVARGATILAEITGYGNFSDAHDVTAPAPDLMARTKTVEVAMQVGGVTPSDIQYINAHGTSTPLNDLNEAQALRKALGQHADKIPMSSTKSYTGHLIAAAGALESIFCIKSMQERFVPATIHLAHPDPECDLDFVPNEHRHDVDIEHCLNVNYGFGGANSCLLFKRIAP